MTARHGPRPALAALAAILLAVVAAGCGITYKMPTETRENRGIPGAGTYQRIDTWTGMAGIQDILLTPSGELFLLFQDPVARRGHVYRYPQSVPTPLAELTGPANDPTAAWDPAAVGFGGNRVFVLDQGDTSAARVDRPSEYFAEYKADADTTTVPLHGFSRPIARLGAYWHVREYYLDGRPVPDGSGGVAGFTDTSFAWVSGVAADVAPDGTRRVYVAGVILFCNVDPFDDHVRTLEFRYRIRRYLPGGGDRFVVGPWRRDRTYLVIEGTGFGSAKDPRGMQWSAAQGPALYFADRGNNQVQKYGDPAGSSTSFKLDIGGTGADSLLLVQPLDVAVDSAGCVYLVDAGNLRVLRYGPWGDFVQRVDGVHPSDVGRPLLGPVAVAADNRQVYVADRGAGEVRRYRRLE